jgi:hypothetical protein
VSPQPINPARLFSSDWPSVSGAAIVLSYTFGGTSGRFKVAEIIARVFPAHSAFVQGVIAREPDMTFPSGPYPADALTYKSKAAVEYVTQAHADGLGTSSGLKRDDRPIIGAAILVGPEPDLLIVAVRLPSALQALTPAIVDQVEREAARHPRGFDN